MHILYNPLNKYNRCGIIYLKMEKNGISPIFILIPLIHHGIDVHPLILSSLQ